MMSETLQVTESGVMRNNSLRGHMRRMASAGAVVVLLGTAVYGDHSHPDFQTDQHTTVEGTIAADL